MSSEQIPNDSPSSFGVSRREMIYGAAGMASAYFAMGAQAYEPAGKGKASPLCGSPKRYDMKKSINMWAFPYPDRMSLRECFELAKRAGFDGVEVNYDLEGDISPKTSDDDLRAIGKMAKDIGITISGICTFLYWPYPFTADDPETRMRALVLAGKMIRAARLLGTENLLVVPGAVFVPWMKQVKEIPIKVVDGRAREAVAKLVPQAKAEGVYLNIENIFVSGYLMTAGELNDFVDSFDSDRVHVHFDTGNIMFFQFPEDWIPQLGKRIKNVHLKEYTKKGTDFSIEAFRPLLDGTTNWPAVIEAFDKVGYRGYLTFEYFHPFTHYPEALIYHTSDALDRLLGRKTT